METQEMMILTEEQVDTVTELINISFGRAAASLSSLTGQKVLLDLPQVVLRPIEQLPEALGEFLKGEVATVHQIFSGSFSGNALLLLDYQGAVILSGLLTNDRVPVNRLDAADREVLTEVGNILLNACLGTFGNILKVHIAFSVPRMRIESLGALLTSLTIDSEELHYALAVVTNFHLRENAVGGWLVMVLGVSSLDRLLEAVEKL